MITSEHADLLSRAQQMLVAMRKHPPGSAPRLLLDNFLPEAGYRAFLDWIDAETRKIRLPVVFSLEIPGFVWMGLEGDRTFPVRAPKKTIGLEAAWEIFLYGENASFVWFAARYGLTPDGLRNALRRAADWAGTRCPQLGVAINAIKVAKDGSALFAPAYPTDVRLHVFSAYSRNQSPR